jgi:flagellar biosynthesis protein FliR
VAGAADPILTAWLLAQGGAAPLALALARAAGLAWTAPALGTPGLGARGRLVLAAVLAVVLAPAAAVKGGAGAVWPSVASLAVACVGEVVVGAALGWSASLVVAGARQAGEVVGAQAGLSAAALFDPEAGDELTALGHLYGLVALGVFLSLDGPLALARALAESYRVFPPGEVWGGVLTSGAARDLAFGRVGEALGLAVRAAAPVALGVAMAGLALGLLGRASPSLPLVALAVPVRAAVGLLLVLLGMVSLAVTLAAAWSAWPGAGLGLGLGVSP